MSGERIPLMAHLVAGYPDAAGSLAAARGLAEGGAAFLEVQIPFSDPSADGPAIRDACSASLAGGFTVARSFELIASLHAEFPALPIFIMAYASLVATPGAAAFADAARRAGAAGLIVPDLPFDADEGLAAACAAGDGKAALAAVPVAAPSMRPERLAAMAGLGRPYLYAALRAGITGAATEIGEDTKAFLGAAASGGSKVLGGFGIRTGAQARAVAPHVDAVVAGSVFVEAISQAVAAQAAGRGADYAGSPRVRDEAIRRAVAARAAEIVGG
jgi:tryptophan synthase alpha chain